MFTDITLPHPSVTPVPFADISILINYTLLAGYLSPSFYHKLIGLHNDHWAVFSYRNTLSHHMFIVVNLWPIGTHRLNHAFVSACTTKLYSTLTYHLQNFETHLSVHVRFMLCVHFHLVVGQENM
jgi:hypothetical protein